MGELFCEERKVRCGRGVDKGYNRMNIQTLEHTMYPPSPGKNEMCVTT